MVVALLAGATGGIGAAVLDRLLEAGRVAGHPISGLVVLDLFPDAKQLESFQEDLAAKCSVLLPAAEQRLVMPWNASEYSSTQEVCCKVQAQFGRLDAVIIASGIGFHGDALETSPEKTAKVFRTLMDVNALGPILLTRMCLPLLLEPHASRVITPRVVVMSSISGYLGLPKRSLYCASKYALNGFFETLSLELKDGQKEVGLVLVCPVTVQTNFRANWKNKFGEKEEGGAPSSGVTVKDCVDSICASLDRDTPKALERVFIPSSARWGYSLVRLPVIGERLEQYIAGRAKL